MQKHESKLKAAPGSQKRQGRNPPPPNFQEQPNPVSPFGTHGFPTVRSNGNHVLFEATHSCGDFLQKQREAGRASIYSRRVRKPGALLLIFSFLMHRCMCVCVEVHTCVHVCRGQMPSVSFEMSLSLIWSSPIRLDYLDTEPQAASGLHPCTGFANVFHHTQHFYMSSGGCSGPYACRTNILWTEPSPHLDSLFFFSHFWSLGRSFFSFTCQTARRQIDIWEKRS